MSTTQNMVFLFRHGAYVSGSLDIALTAAAFEQDISLIFMGDGVLQLLKGQNGDAIGLKNTSGVFSALDLYEIDKVFVEEESMKTNSLSQADLIIPAKVINNTELSSLLQHCDQVFSH